MNEVTVTATNDGVRLALLPAGREPFYWTVPLQGAIAFWMHWWEALSTQYPEVANSPKDKELPIMVVTGDFNMAVSAQSDALVRLVLQPTGLAGMGFEFQPEEARGLARELLEMADSLDAPRSPN